MPPPKAPTTAAPARRRARGPLPGFGLSMGVTLLMLGLVCLATALSYAAACSGVGGFIGITITCDLPGLITLIRALLAAIVVNQSVFLLSPKG